MFDHPGLRVSAASPEHLLAMKVLAARRRDGDDIRFLVKHLNLATADDVLALCAEIFPTGRSPHGLAWFWKMPSATSKAQGNASPGRTPRP